MDFRRGTLSGGLSRARVVEGAPIGETQLLFARPDISDFLSLPHDVPTAFRFLARAAGGNEASREATIQLTVSWNGDAAEYSIGKVPVHLVPAFLQNRHFGEVVFPAQSRVLHRENIYGSGPPVLEPGVEMLRLILDYLSPRSSVLDVGCGAGAYGPAVIACGASMERHRSESRLLAIAGAAWFAISQSGARNGALSLLGRGVR